MFSLSPVLLAVPLENPGVWEKIALLFGSAALGKLVSGWSLCWLSSRAQRT
jgi:hypothetical protein